MIPVQFEYVVPTSLEAAVQQLQKSDNAQALAGGMSLFPAMKLRCVAPMLLVDLRNIAELHRIQHDDKLQISAMTTYAEILADQQIKAKYPALAEAIESISDPQVRNRGTLGGSLAYNDPAADVPAVALALEALIHTVGANGQRAIPADALLVGTYKTSLLQAELIVSVDFPELPANTGSAYEKFKHPASGYAVCGVAAAISKASNGSVSKCRVALTGAADHAVRLQKVEAALEGKEPTMDNLAAAAERIADEGFTFLTDLAASAEYRAHLAKVLAERSLARAAERAG